jgi:hypothetical protein
LNFALETGHITAGLVLEHSSTAPQWTLGSRVPHVSPWTEQLDPIGGQGAPASFVKPVGHALLGATQATLAGTQNEPVAHAHACSGGTHVPASDGARHTESPHVQYHCIPVLPPELDELPPEPDELPLELDEPPPQTVSHPCPHVSDEAHPSAGL